MPPQDETAGSGFLARMGEAYGSRHGPEQVTLHQRLAGELGPGRPVRVHASPAPAGRLDVTIVGYDFFSAFALLSGALAARGLDIEAGRASTSSPASEPARPAAPARLRDRGSRRLPARATAPPAARLIVDEFRVAPRGALPGLAPEETARQLEADLVELLTIVSEGRLEEARERLGRRLAERFSGREPSVGALAPLAIDFDNASDPHWTRMEVRGADTPGFLYALATALAVRNLYVHEVDIASVGREARDVFLIGGREGRKLEDPAELARLRVAVALVKQFSHLLPLAPDPARALRSFGQLVDRVLDEDAPGLHLLDSPEGLRELARLLGASSFLWEDFIRLQSEHLLPVLDSWRERPLRGRAALVRDLSARAAAAPTFEERQRVVNGFKDEEMLLADVRHLVDPKVDLLVFSAAISDLAETVVEVALRACLDEVARREGGVPPLGTGAAWPVAALGLGKLGGREMGYASDLELVFVYEPTGPFAGAPDAGRLVEQAVQELTRFVVAREEGIFHIDLRLRPHGAKGPLASPLEALAEYYRPGGGAAPFERQALVKLRPVAGDAALGARAIAARDAFVWSGEPWDRADALHLRERQSRELVPAGRFHVKYSPGALVEVEYAAQYLQLEHGREHVELRTPSTLEALDRLGQAGLIGADDREALRAAYLFWRRVVDALRMVRGNARDLLLPEADSDELRFLARRLGYSGTDWKQAGGAFLADLRRHREAVERFFKARFRG